jgi:dipeptidyl aminopeptidase/acylaminoacyl peptidase
LLRALRERGQEAHLVLYPVPGHLPGDPVRARDVYRRWVEWFAEKFQ